MPIKEEDENDEAAQESAKSDHIAPHPRQRSPKPIAQGYAQQMKALAPQIRSRSPLHPNEKKESKGHDHEKQQNEYDRLQNKIKYDHTIDLDSEPNHSELHDDNKVFAKEELERE